MLIIENIKEFNEEDSPPIFTFKCKITEGEEILGYKVSIKELDGSIIMNRVYMNSKDWYIDTQGNINFNVFIDFINTRKEMLLKTKCTIIIEVMNSIDNSWTSIKPITITSKCIKRKITFDKVIQNRQFKKNEVFIIASQATATLEGEGHEEILPNFTSDLTIYQPKEKNFDNTKWTIELRDGAVDTISIVNYNK